MLWKLSKLLYVLILVVVFSPNYLLLQMMCFVGYFQNISLLEVLFCDDASRQLTLVWNSKSLQCNVIVRLKRSFKKETSLFGKFFFVEIFVQTMKYIKRWTFKHLWSKNKILTRMFIIRRLFWLKFRYIPWNISFPNVLQQFVIVSN